MSGPRRRRELVRTAARAELLDRAHAWSERSEGQEWPSISSKRGALDAFARSGLTARKVHGEPWWLLSREGEEVGSAHLGACLTVYGPEIDARVPNEGPREHVALPASVWDGFQAETGTDHLSRADAVRELDRRWRKRQRYRELVK